jgi:hypothetical protein
LALVVWIPRTQEIVTYGNPTMWVAAAVAAGTVWRWPAAFVLLKASLLPFALIGATRRAWWVTVGVLVLVSLPFGGMWLDYAKVVTGMQTPSWMYSLSDIPLVGIGLIAWAARARRRDR